jgi:beta-galactosidase
VLEPAFHWALGDENSKFDHAVVCSNCEHLKFYIAGKLVAEADPDRTEFAHLKYPPFSVGLAKYDDHWGDLKIEGYIGGKLVVTRLMSGDGVDRRLVLAPDTTRLIADGADTTRVAVRVTDEFGNVRPFSDAAIRFEIVGPAELIGDNPFPLVGGQGAVWVRTFEMSGQAQLRATHPYLGTQHVDFEIQPAKDELL